MSPASRLLVIPVAFAIAWATLGASGCGIFRDPPPSKYESQPVYVQDTTLGPRDVFEVRVFKHDDMSKTYAVSDEGTINFPEIGQVQVAGKTPAQVEVDIQTRLADGYLVNPIVSVLVKEYKSKTVSVLGQVRKPSTINYVSGLSIVDAISQAGGFTPMARKNAVKVTRKGATDGATESFTIPVESIASGKAKDFYLRPGDAIFVPERWY
ncbi:MAG: polysaccharide export protein [Kofleriaceae bacterium]|nr:polysaccharide export protein [Kofleriaceae bacterium]MCB9574352.1 polysaccharide export protein [Kofleriaceae bacterium]